MRSCVFEDRRYVDLTNNCIAYKNVVSWTANSHVRSITNKRGLQKGKNVTILSEFNGPEREIKCSTNSPLNKSIVKRAVRHVTPPFWNHMSCKSSSYILAKKSWIWSHGSSHHLRYDSQNLWWSTIQWRHQPINHTELWLFLDALVAFAMLLADLHSKIDNPTCLCINWAKYELRCWTQFFDKEVDLRPTFQEPIS